MNRAEKRVRTQEAEKRVRTQEAEYRIIIFKSKKLKPKNQTVKPKPIN